MKSDEDVRVIPIIPNFILKMISAEAPVLFAKACELFIIELTHRAWLYTEEGKRRTLQVKIAYFFLTRRKMILLSVLQILISLTF